MEIKSESTQPCKTTRDFRDLVSTTADAYGGQEAYIVKCHEDVQSTSRYRHITYDEFRQEIRAIGTALIDMYPDRTAHIAVTGENRYEWCLAYLAVTCSGFVVVPIDKELKAEEISMILTTAGVSGVVSSPRVYNKALKEALLTNPQTKNVVLMDSQEDNTSAGDDGRNYTDIKALIKRGNELLDAGDKRYDETVIDPKALAVLIFTSGTTGTAKGVMLSQHNICSDIDSVIQCLDNGPTDSMLSILPLHHTYECTCSFLVTIKMGGRLAFCEGTRYIAKNIQEYKPTIVMLVPLIIENVHAKIMKQAKSNIFKFIGFKTLMLLSIILKFFRIDAGKKLFPMVHENLGGRLRLIIAGAAAMSPKVSRDLTRMGFKIRQGYGLTECSPILCVNRESGSEYASVGPAMPNIYVKIDNPDEDGQGEIIAKGENIMLGYYKDEASTKAVLSEDGWFRTGDRGRMDKHGRIYVTGRIKNMIVNKTGKNIYPEELEALLAKIPYVLESVVWGDNDSSDEDTIVCATVVPNAEAIRDRTKIEPEAVNEVEKLIWHEVKKINKGLPTYKRIQRIDIRTEEFEKTTTQKIKRYVLDFARKVVTSAEDVMAEHTEIKLFKNRRDINIQKEQQEQQAQQERQERQEQQEQNGQQESARR